MQLLADICNYLEISAIKLQISANNYRYLQLFADIFNSGLNVKTACHKHANHQMALPQRDFSKWAELSFLAALPPIGSLTNLRHYKMNK